MPLLLLKNMKKITHLNSPSKGRMTFEDMLADLKRYMLDDQKRNYNIIVGTDSKQHIRTDIVTAIVIHRVGAGGRYFWSREQKDNFPSLRHRIYTEALKSLEVAEVMTKGIYNILKKEDSLRFNIEIHVDIGENGPTRDMIREVVGMITGNGYEVKIKPFGYGAFVIADRHT